MRCCVGVLVQGTRIFNTICDTWSTRDSPVSRRPRRRLGCLWCRTTAPCTALASPGIDDVTPSGGHKIVRNTQHCIENARHAYAWQRCVLALSPVPHSDYGTTSHVSTAVTAGVLCYILAAFGARQSRNCGVVISSWKPPTASHAHSQPFRPQTGCRRHCNQCLLPGAGCVHVGLLVPLSYRAFRLYQI